MKKHIYILSTCTTCKRILAEINCADITIQDIKTNKITPEQLEEMHHLAGSYTALFTKRSMKYRSMGLADKTLSETMIKELILTEYTFLKRPVAIVGDKIFIGNSKQNIADLKAALNSHA